MSTSLTNFDSFFQDLKNAMLNDFQHEPNLKTTLERLEKMIDYNVPHGKKLRGMCTYESFAILSNNEAPIEYINKAKALGWCIELLQAAFLVADDIMDNSKTRRGQPCWYLNKDVGNVAINDSFFLIFAVNRVIRKYLHDHEMYPKFFELFDEVSIQTTIGQALDLEIGTHDLNAQLFDFSKFSHETYASIVKWKTAFYSFVLPVASALYLAKIDNANVHAKCREILLQMGHFFQVQDDHLDCYGDPKVTGKIGTDIEEGKCSWLVTQALSRCSAQQRETLQKNYGKVDRDQVANVKALYNELNMKELYEVYELEQFNEITNKINNELGDFDERYQSQIKQLLNVFARKFFKRTN